MKKICIIFLMALWASPAFATIRYVNASVVGSTSTGLSWENAYTDLQLALLAASSGDEIWVAQGIYKPTATTSQTISFVMKIGVGIYGGFTAGQMNLTDRNSNPATNGTVLSGEINNDGLPNGNSYHVIFNDGNSLTSTAILDGFTITGGNASGSGGGGMYNQQSSPLIRNCIFDSNRAQDGGAMFNDVFSSVQLTNCIFKGNIATNIGGAMVNTGSSNSTFTNCSFQSNSAVDGGALYNLYDSQPTLVNCSFQGNTATGSGGAVYTNIRSSTSLTNCVLWNNGGNKTFSQNGSSPIQVSYTLFEGTVTNFVNGSNNLTTAVTPFASTTSTQLLPTSGAIDSGLGSANPTATDLAGNPRVANGTIDRGAYEFVPSADLSITKTDGVTTATPGGSVTYTITASNAGPSNVTGATVADMLPASLTPTWTCVGAGGGSCTAAGSGNINDVVNLPSGGSVTYTVTATLAAGSTGTLSNTATVSSSVTDPNPANNSATDTDALTPSADLSITKTDGVSTLTPGGSVTYTITASNAGPSNATGATVTDTYPVSLTSVTWTCVGAGGGTCTAAGSGNLNDAVNLPSGGSVTYTVTATLAAGSSGTLSNTATVTAPGGVNDPNPGNNSATDTDNIVCPAITVQASGNTSVILGFGGPNSNCTTLGASASGGSGPYTYAWEPGGLSGPSVQVCPQMTTTYNVTATDQASGCTGSTTITVNVQDVRCGNKLQNVQICYYGVTQCVSEKIAKNYLKLGATLGACGGSNARLSAEEGSELPLTLSLKAYPNPIQDAVTVEVMSRGSGVATFEVLDLTGRAWQSRRQDLKKGLNEVEFKLGTLPTGIYLIRAVDALGQQGVVRVSKQ